MDEKKKLRQNFDNKNNLCCLVKIIFEYLQTANKDLSFFILYIKMQYERYGKI